MSQVIYLLLGDCRKRSAELRAERGDGFLGAMVADPPYEISFMGRVWDNSGVAFDVATWEEVFLALEPGGVLKVFSATRTYHRMIPPIEEAGFVDVRLEAWVQGEGFPKGLDISKALDKMAGAERKVTGVRPIAYPDSGCWGTPNKNVAPTSGIESGLFADGENTQKDWSSTKGIPITAPATDDAKKWAGYNVALKPSWEVIIVARRPG